MKKLLFIIFSLLLFTNNNVYSTRDDTFIISLTQSKSEHQEKPDKGKRTPGKAETCIIDFNRTTIQTYLSDEIAYYELWDEEGLSALASFSTDSEMVLLMSQQNGIFQLRIITYYHIYIGYIEL